MPARRTAAMPTCRHFVARPTGWRFLLLATLALACAGVQAGTLGLSWDDDGFFGRDYGYTAGWRLSYVTDRHDDCASDPGAVCTAAALATALPGMGRQDHHAGTISLRQVMLTPRNLQRVTPDFGDLPYVGYASIELGLYDWNQRSLTGYGLRLGVVGPASGAGWLQRLVHRTLHVHYPAGWGNQLGQDPMAGLFATHFERGPGSRLAGGREWQMVYGGTLDAGTFETDADAQVFLRFGRNLAGNFAPDYRALSGPTGLVGLDGNTSTGWEVFVGLDGRYNAHTYASSRSGAYDVRRQPWTAGVLAGASLRMANGTVFALTLQRAKSPLSRGGALNFGTLSVSWPL